MADVTYTGTPGATYPLKFDHDGDGDVAASISQEHMLIHEGKMFSATSLNTALASEASFSYLIATPAAKDVHALFDMTSSRDMSITWYTYGAVTASTNTMTLVNLNRESTNTASTVISTGPTVTTVTTSITTLSVAYVPTGAGGLGSGARAGAGGQNREHEFIFAPASKNVVTLTNLGTAAAIYGVEFSLYERE